MILAFWFVSPLLLWGLLLAGVPLLIQWLHRRKYTERVWAAMRFLRAATESQTRRLRMESLLLLCVRTLILLLVAMALAEPYFDDPPWRPDGDVSTHTLIVLDTSLSMRASVDGVTVGDRAKGAARDIVQSGKTGDSYQLLTIAARPEQIIRQPSFSTADVLAEIDRLAMTKLFGNVPAAIDAAGRLSAEASSAGRQRVAIISDFQRTNWEFTEPAEQQRTRKALTQMAQHATVVLAPVGVAETGNLAVQDARIESSLVSAGQPVSITAQVRNHGPETKRQQRLQLVEEGRILQVQTIDVPPYAEVTVVFVSQWSDPGLHALQIRLEPDRLTADNDRWLTLDVKESLSVLLVNGRASVQDLEGATDFVELALRPVLTAGTDPAARLRSAWAMQPTVIRETELIRTDLASFDCVFLCDVPLLGHDEVSRLSTFVKEGGGLVIGMGEQVQLDDYSRQLGADGSGLLPVQLLRVVGDASAETDPYRFAEPIIGHPLTRSFAGNPRSGLTTANIYRYVETRLSEESSARTALAYAHGAPAIIEHQFGSGRVVLVTTSLDDRWGSWALWPSFLPMMHELVEYVIQGENKVHTLVGEPIHVTLPQQGVIGQSVKLRRPDGRSSTLNVPAMEQTAGTTIDETSQSGVYQLAIGPPADVTKMFAVNVDPRKSALQTLGEDDFSESILGSARYELTGPTGLSAPVTEPDPSTARLTSWLLLSVLALLFVEQIMAWNGRYGLAALLVSPLAVAGLATAPAASMVLGAVAFVGTSAWRWRHRLLSVR